MSAMSERHFETSMSGKYHYYLQEEIKRAFFFSNGKIYKIKLKSDYYQGIFQLEGTLEITILTSSFASEAKHTTNNLKMKKINLLP